MVGDSESYPSAQPGNQGRTTQLNALGARLERGRAGPGRLRGARTPYHIPMILQGCRWSRSWPPSSAICEHARASRPRKRNNSVLNAPATRLVRPCSQHCKRAEFASRQQRSSHWPFEKPDEEMTTNISWRASSRATPSAASPERWFTGRQAAAKKAAASERRTHSLCSRVGLPNRSTQSLER